MTINTRISKLKSSARQRGIKVRLMDYEYEALLSVGCMYCGKELLSENGTCLDRIDSDKDYTLHNVTPCCKRCNMAKNDMELSEFINWIERAYLFQKAQLEKVQKLQDDGIIHNHHEEKKLYKTFFSNEDSKCIRVK